MSTVKEMRRELNMEELDRVVGGRELTQQEKNTIETWMEDDYLEGATKEEVMNGWIYMGMPEAAEYVDQRWEIMLERRKLFYGEDY